MIAAMSGGRLRFAAAGTLLAWGLLLPGAPASAQVKPEPSECQGPERSEAELRRLTGTPAATPTDPLPIGIPSGPPVDPDTAEAIKDVTLELVACFNAGSPVRLASLFTEALLRPLDLPDQPLSALPPVTPLPMAERVTLLGVWNIQALSDGRVVATVAIDMVDDPHPAPGRTSYFFFAREDGEWRIDEMTNEVFVDGQWVFVADLVGPPPGTPTPT